MVDEHEEGFEAQEEGEYHFSDEHASYDLEPETTAPKAEPAAKVAGAAMAGISRYRRMAIVGGVFIAVMLVVYRLVSPSSPPQATDFTQTAAANMVKAQPPLTPQAIDTSKPATPPPAQPPAQVAQAPSAATPVQQPQQAQPAQPQAAAYAQAGQGSPATPVAAPIANSAQGNPAALPNPAMPPAVAAGQQPTVTTMSGAGQPQQPMNDRVASVEQQNAKLSNLLQIDYAQRLADYAAQEAAMQTKIQELNARVASMETVINQLNQLLQQSNGRQAPAPTVSASNKADSGKMSYTVQAIIPGRAWLKSDGGDTVTVAEGDVLKDYGRITKIDPYDGIVQIDTGSKTLTLSYGLSADS